MCGANAWAGWGDASLSITIFFSRGGAFILLLWATGVSVYFPGLGTVVQGGSRERGTVGNCVVGPSGADTLVGGEEGFCRRGEGNFESNNVGSLCYFVCRGYRNEGRK